MRTTRHRSYPARAIRFFTTRYSFLSFFFSQLHGCADQLNLLWFIFIRDANSGPSPGTIVVAEDRRAAAFRATTQAPRLIGKWRNSHRRRKAWLVVRVRHFPVARRAPPYCTCPHGVALRQNVHWLVYIARLVLGLHGSSLALLAPGYGTGAADCRKKPAWPPAEESACQGASASHTPFPAARWAPPMSHRAAVQPPLIGTRCLAHRIRESRAQLCDVKASKVAASVVVLAALGRRLKLTESALELRRRGVRSSAASCII